MREIVNFNDDWLYLPKDRASARSIEADERGFEMLRRLRAEHGSEKSLAEFKQDLREQYCLLRLDEHRAVELIPALLKGHEQDGPRLLEMIRKLEHYEISAMPVVDKGCVLVMVSADLIARRSLIRLVQEEVG